MENKVLAVVNGKDITQQNVEDFIKRLDPQTAAHYRSAEGQKNVLNELINQELFLADAVNSDLDQTDAYKIEMDKARNFILTQLNINNLLASQSVSDGEAKAFFEKNPQLFAEPEKANTSHILVDTIEQCKDLRAKIVNNEISFEDAAKQYSKCPSKDKGGNLGEYAKGQMVPEYDNAAFALSVNEMSEPVKTQFGYHLIKLHSKTESSGTDYEVSKSKVHQQLLSLKQKQAFTEKVNQMRATQSVEIM